MTPIERLSLRVSTRFADAGVALDAPRDPKGLWFLDVSDGDYSLQVQWREGRPFGVTATKEIGSYGAGPHEALSDVESAMRRIVALVLGRGLTRPVHTMPLSELRKTRGLTQTDLAKRLALKQAAISRLETRHDMRLSSLTTAVSAMGGELQLRVRFPDGTTIRLEPPGERAKEKP